LVLMAVTVPALASTVAAGTGLMTATAVGRLRRRRRSASSVTLRELGIFAPYLILLALALPLLALPSTSSWVRANLLLAPSFPGTATMFGWENQPQAAYNPIALFAHPGSYIIAATALGYLTYRRLGLWGAG